MRLVEIILQSDMELKPDTQGKLLGPFSRRVGCLLGLACRSRVREMSFQIGYARLSISQESKAAYNIGSPQAC